MEQFVLVLASVCNKSWIIQSVTKQDIPKYEPSQKLPYQVDSHKNEINKKLFFKAHSLVDKNLSCRRIKLSKSQTSVLDGVENEFFSVGLFSTFLS